MDEETVSEEPNHKRRNPAESFSAVELTEIPMGPGMVPLVGVGAPPPIPAAEPKTFVCLRGPCRHYWQLEMHFDAGNPEETWDPEIGLKDEHGDPIRAPRKIERVCLAHPGVETELEDTAVLECSRWSPMTPREVKKLAKLRAKYFKRFPDHDPSFVPADRLKR